MRFNSVLSILLYRTSSGKVCLRHLITVVKYSSNFKKWNNWSPLGASVWQKTFSINRPQQFSKYIDSDVSGSDNEIDSDSQFDYLKDFGFEDRDGFARDLLYKKPDFLQKRIYNCVSIQELFNLFETNSDDYKCVHIAQTVLVLYDLKKIYHAINDITDHSSSEFYDKLKMSEHFQELLQLVLKRLNDFDVTTLSYILFYLNKIGMIFNSELLQTISQRLEKELLKEFAIAPASRLLETAFKNFSIQSYLFAQKLIPLCFEEIDKCSVATLKYVTISLNKLHNVVTDETLLHYKKKIETFIEDGALSAKDADTILQIVAFLNYPKWREKNAVLISQCILLLKNNLYTLNVNQITLLYKIFFKLEEPGVILSELQRCAFKHLNQLEAASITTQKITLFSIIIYFSSPSHRMEFQKTMRKYVQDCDDYESLILLRKALSYMKISDFKLCQCYWDKILNFVQNDDSKIDLLRLSQNYLYFNTDIDGYRHHKLESELLLLLENVAKQPNYQFFPQKLAHILSFVLIFGNNMKFLEFLVTKCEENWMQLAYNDCYKLASSLRILDGIKNKFEKLPFAHRINNLVNQILIKEKYSDNYLWKNDTLIKASIFKNNTDRKVLNELLLNYRDLQDIHSKNLENIAYSFIVTSTLIPEVLEKILDYIMRYNDHILGFNMGKILYLCYSLGYHPQKSSPVLEIATNVIIRDLERMTGLSIIQSALALCFFNKLPQSLIKFIFHVEFMDKLDNELKNCYSKEKYPQRVRHNLMQLNRAVCLDCPDSNVPWFHQKYLEECRSATSRQNIFAARIKEYLTKIVQSPNSLEENIKSPYGYDINFVITLNGCKKLAVLLIPELAYTSIYSQLKGSYQLKKRHLEILGYSVILVNFREWITLFYAEERFNFLNKLIFETTS